MNKILLIGRLTKDPELRYTPNGAAVTNFTLAVNRNFVGADGKKEVDFILIVVWNKQAENCAKYLAKGSQVAVEGRLQIRTYDDTNGNRRWVPEVTADHVEFLSKKSSRGNTDQSDNDGASHFDLGEEISFNDEELPFSK